MKWNEVEDNWKQFKGKVREEWGRLTNDDVDVIAGNRQQLEGKIQEYYGKSPKEIEHEIESWLARS